MALSQQFLDELRACVGLADVIGRRVRLVRKGREHSGLCPFHNEKTPSFTVNEEKGFYHCFGCGAHGGVIDFVMQIDKLSFPEAVERLAAEAGMEVPRASAADRERETRAKSLLEVVEAACKFFERQLRMPDGKAAYDYLIRRGIRDDTIGRFRLGFAPDGRGALKAHLAREGVSEDLMVEAGLVIRPEDEGRVPYDRFRGRVMFPIMDARSRVIAFGGRVMGEGEPKYLNSPETALFHKGFNLYGLAQALPVIRVKGQVVVVEGYTDVIALHQAGIAMAVAPLGTALTEDQMRLLWRHAAEPILCFDGDSAGQRAAARAAERALPILQAGKGLRFVELPQGEDPDTLVRARGATAVADLLRASRPLSDVIWQIETRGRRTDTPEARAGLDARFRELTARIADETVRRHYQSAYRGRVWDLYKKSRGGGTNALARKRVGEPAGRMPERAGASAHVDRPELQERILFGILLLHPLLFDVVAEQFGSISFSSDERNKLRQTITEILTRRPETTSDELFGTLENRGFGYALATIMDNVAFKSAKVPKREKDEANPLATWEHVFQLYQSTALDSELTRHQDEASDRPDLNLERITAIKGEILRSKRVEGSSEETNQTQGLTDENKLALKEIRSRGMAKT